MVANYGLDLLSNLCRRVAIILLGDTIIFKLNYHDLILIYYDYGLIYSGV